MLSKFFSGNSDFTHRCAVVKKNASCKAFGTEFREGGF